MGNSTTLFISVMLSIVGLAYFSYGRKQRVIVPLSAGLALMVFPYFVTNNVLLSIIGTLLIIIPFIFKL